MPDSPCTADPDAAWQVAAAASSREARTVVSEIEAALALAMDLGDPDVVAAVEACLASARGRFDG